MRFNAPIALFLLTVYSLTVMSESRRADQDHNLRLSKNFYGESNILSTMPAGTEYTVLSRDPLPSGANSLKIQITAPEQLVKLNKNAPLYIWEKSSHRRNRDQDSNLNLPDGACAECNLNTNSASDPNISQIRDITYKIEEDNSSVDAFSDAAIQSYSNSEEVNNSIKWFENNVEGKKIKRGVCYRYVKKALYLNGSKNKSRLVNHYLNGRSAYMGASALKKNGFVNLLDDPRYKNLTPETAPKGAIIVYTGGSTPHGHIEMKLDAGTNSRFASNFVARNAVNSGRFGYTYKVKAIMIKKM